MPHRRRRVGEIRPSAAVAVVASRTTGMATAAVVRARTRSSILVGLPEEPSLLYSSIPIRSSAERATLHSARLRLAVLSRQYH